MTSLLTILALQYLISLHYTTHITLTTTVGHVVPPTTVLWVRLVLMTCSCQCQDEDVELFFFHTGLGVAQLQNIVKAGYSCVSLNDRSMYSMWASDKRVPNQF